MPFKWLDDAVGYWRHFSKSPDLVSTDPGRFGSGLKGPDLDRVRRAGGPGRTYFYLDPDARPEAGTGPYEYVSEVDQSGIYDFDSDPEGLVRAARAASTTPDKPTEFGLVMGGVDKTAARNRAEQAVLDAGYRGFSYTDPGTGRVGVLFDAQDVRPVADFFPARATRETAPGATVKGHLPGISADPELKRAYDNRVRELLYPDGSDPFTSELGMEPDQMGLGVGVYEGQSSPGHVSLVRGNADDLNITESVYALLNTQDAYGFNRPGFGGNLNSLSVDVGRPLSEAEMGALAARLSELDPDAFPALTPTGVDLIHPGFDGDARELRAIFDQAVDAAGLDGARRSSLSNSTGYAENNWSDNPMGQQYVDRIMQGTPEQVAAADALVKRLARERNAIDMEFADAAGGVSKDVIRMREILAEKGVSGLAQGDPAPPKPRKPRKKDQTVLEAQRNAFPGVYLPPDEVAAMAAARVAPESPALKRLFGVTREDLSNTARSRSGNITDPVLPGASAKPKGSAAAKNVMNPRNTQRLVDSLVEAEKHPGLYQGMTGWYVMDPAYQRLEQLWGADEARRLYERFNTFSGMASPGSDVVTELNRGTAANALANQGRFGEFLSGGGKSGQIEGMPNVQGHPYHKTAQGKPMQDYLETGEVQMKSPKVPMYIQASGVPETGFQTRIPVGDAHWSRAVGLADTRTSQGYAASVSTPEMQQLAPWWESKVAGAVDLESVPAQALTWGTYGPQTGVATMIGAPKLEILADEIMKAAKREGVSPETMRDLVLSGKAHAGMVDPKLLAAVGIASGAAVVAGSLEAGVRGSITDTLSGYSDEALRLMHRSALDEGMEDEAARYAQELELRQSAGTTRPRLASQSTAAGAATVGYATSEFAAAESSLSATEDDFRASAERFKALRKGKRAHTLSSEVQRVLAPVAGPATALMDAAEVMLVGIAGGIPGYLSELTGYVRGQDLEEAKAGGEALTGRLTGSLAETLGKDWDPQNPYLQGLASAMEQGEKEFQDAYRMLGVDNSVMKKGWDALPERAQRIITGLADLAL